MCAAAGVIGKAPIQENCFNVANNQTVVGQCANAIIAIIVNDNIALNQHVSTDRDIADNKEPLSAICIVFD